MKLIIIGILLTYCYIQTFALLKAASKEDNNRKYD